MCPAIIDVYGEEVFTCPQNAEDWRAVADGFKSRWNFLHTCGAIDGKHIAIKKPENSGSLYYNYKGFFSIVLLAIVDSDYKFQWVDVGAEGSASDAGIFNRSPLLTALEENLCNFPRPESLPGDRSPVPVPYFLVGDDAFPLRPWMMKPYAQRGLDHPQTVFNYRLSRARRVVENAFGILANRFRCMLTTMQQQPETVRTIVMAALCLHNLMRRRYPTLQNSLMDKENRKHKVTDGQWRREEQLVPVCEPAGNNTGIRVAKKQRDHLKEYYSEVGAVPWQDFMV